MHVFQEGDNASGGDLNDRGHGNDDPNTKGSEDEVQTTTQPFQTHIDEVLQAHRKLLNEGHLNAEHVYGGEDLPVMIPSVEEKQQHTGNHEKKSVANDDCWLSAEICWKVLGTPPSLHSFQPSCSNSHREDNYHFIETIPKVSKPFL